MLNRRQALGLGGAAALTVALAGCGGSGDSSAASTGDSGDKK